MLCEKCQKNIATVHVQQTFNGIKTELHLCPACSIPPEIPVSAEDLFDNLFQGFLNSILSKQTGAQNNLKEQMPTVKCPTCGTTYEMFKSSGKLGCADCYRTFASEMEELLKNVQGSTRHEGKFPQHSGFELRQKHEIDRLRVRLTKAVEAENFEEAAELRDHIRALEAAPKADA